MSACISTAQACPKSAPRVFRVLGARHFSCKWLLWDVQSISIAQARTQCAPEFWPPHFSCKFSHKIALVRTHVHFDGAGSHKTGVPFLLSAPLAGHLTAWKLHFFSQNVQKIQTVKKAFDFSFFSLFGWNCSQKVKKFSTFQFFLFFFDLFFPLFDFLFFGSLRVFSTLRLKKEKGFHFLILFFTFSDFSRQNRQQALNSANFSTLKKSMCSTCWLFMFSTFCSTVKFAYFFSLVQQTR
jgi:hypothetical protein